MPGVRLSQILRDQLDDRIEQGFPRARVATEKRDSVLDLTNNHLAEFPRARPATPTSGSASIPYRKRPSYSFTISTTSCTSTASCTTPTTGAGSVRIPPRVSTAAVACFSFTSGTTPKPMNFQFHIRKNNEGWYWGLLSGASKGVSAYGIPGHHALTCHDCTEPYFQTRKACAKSLERRRLQIIDEITKAPARHIRKRVLKSVKLSK